MKKSTQSAIAATPLVRAKLHRESGGVRVLKRRRLGPPPEFMNGSCSVALIAAPAGYGKSILMGSWSELLRDEGIATGWLSLDANDEDPVRLMRHLVAALQEIQPSIGVGATGLLTADWSGDFKPALELLAADLSGIEGRAALFLDDLHFLVGDAAIEIVNWLINYSPPNLQFILGTRRQPSLHLGTLRVRRKLVELGTPELQFTHQEAAEFYAARLGGSLGEKDLQQLIAKTEGWPAALELAALALLAESDRSAMIERFAGTVRGIVDYLGEAVLLGLDPKLRDFVLRTAQFDRICAPLAAEVTDEVNTAELLTTLVSRNLFLMPLDQNGEWYRFHHLAADFFRDRFAREGGDKAAVLMRGAAWLYQRGFTEEAINTAIRAEAWDTAAGWIAESVEELVYRLGYHYTIMRWMAQLPAESVDRFPTIRIHYAFALAFSPQQQEAEAQLHRLEGIYQKLQKSSDTDPLLLDRIQSEIELQKIMSGALRDEGKTVRARAQAWLERWTDAPLIRRGTMANVLAFGLKTAGEIDAALECTARARAWLSQAEGWYSLSWTEYLTALLHMKRGAYIEARTAAHGALDLLQRRMQGHPGQAAQLHAILATVAYEFDELDRAQEHLELCMPRVGEDGQADAVLLGFLTAAKVERLQRGEHIGLKKLQEGQELGARRNLHRVTISLAAEECGWHSRAGRFEEARRIAARHGFEDLPGTIGDSALLASKAFLVASRYVLKDSPAAVIAAVDAPIARCRERGIFRRWVELLLLKTMAYRQSGDLESAANCLREALAIAAPRDYFRTIMDESAGLADVFERLDTNQLQGTAAAPLARRLQQAIREASAHKTAPRAQEAVIVEDLSKRELSILKRLESGLSNKEIADSIFISEGTLKWHLHNVYGKLAVKNRSGALSKARALNLI